MNTDKVQDWEVNEEEKPEVWRLVFSEIRNEKAAIAVAKNHAERTTHRCLVATSLRILNPDGTKDRQAMEGVTFFYVYPSGVVEPI
mgnify:CR=1 FL=1